MSSSMGARPDGAPRRDEVYTASIATVIPFYEPRQPRASGGRERPPISSVGRVVRPDELLERDGRLEAIGLGPVRPSDDCGCQLGGRTIDPLDEAAIGRQPAAAPVLGRSIDTGR